MSKWTEFERTLSSLLDLTIVSDPTALLTNPLVIFFMCLNLWLLTVYELK